MYIVGPAPVQNLNDVSRSRQSQENQVNPAPQQAPPTDMDFDTIYSKFPQLKNLDSSVPGCKLLNIFEECDTWLYLYMPYNYGNCLFLNFGLNFMQQASTRYKYISNTKYM